MKKTISLLLVLMLVLTSGIAAFAAAGVPTDVKGSKYEAAVKSLIEKDIMSGYPDGTFLPEKTIDRAEICTIIVKAMNPTADELKKAPNAFNDMKGYDWALQYVNYGASKKVVSGAGNNQFKPADFVTYNEAATMLVNALGYTAKDLTGTWPSSHVNKAKELGIFKDVNIVDKGNTAATRGDIALMTATVADQIIEKYKKEETTPPSTTGGAIAPSDNSAFEKYGGAFGMVVDTAKVINSKGDTVTQLEFFMNGKTYYLNTLKENVTITPDFGGSIHYLKFDLNSAVKSVNVAPDGKPKHFEEYTTSGTWDTVKEKSNTVITCESGKKFNIMSDATFYRLTVDGNTSKEYEKGSLRDIEVGTEIRAYDVTDDDSGLADIVVYVKN